MIDLLRIMPSIVTIGLFVVMVIDSLNVSFNVPEMYIWVFGFVLTAHAKKTINI